MPRPKRPHRRLRIEPLENRALLAITPLIKRFTFHTLQGALDNIFVLTKKALRGGPAHFISRR